MIVVTKLYKTCEVCPSQWSGETADGRAVYIRYRWATLWFEVGGKLVVCMPYGTDYDGYLDFATLRDLLAEEVIFDCVEEYRDVF